MQRTHRPTSHKKDPMKQYQGAVSRAQGKHFEEYIDLSLRYYEQRGEAVVEKTPEPMRPTKDLGNGKFIAYYEKAAQPDYKGTLKGGRAVVFEAKYTHSAQMEQSRVTREQAARLDDHLAAGAMCFVVAGFGNGDVFRIPWEVWRDMKAHFGHRASSKWRVSAKRSSTPSPKGGVCYERQARRTHRHKQGQRPCEPYHVGQQQGVSKKRPLHTFAADGDSGPRRSGMPHRGERDIPSQRRRDSRTPRPSKESSYEM